MRHLLHDPHPVGGVMRLDDRVDGQRRLELRQHQRPLQTRHFHAPAQDVQRATLVQILAHALGQHLRQRRAAGLGQALEIIGLRCFYPR